MMNQFEIINKFTTHTKPIFFAGSNALRYALYHINTGGEVPKSSEDLNDHGEMIDIVAACYWRDGSDPLFVPEKVVTNKDVHAKIYITNGGNVIFASQNNGNSNLFEFAILFEYDEALYEWAEKQIERANRAEWIRPIGRGRYKNYTWDWVKKNDPDYYSWAKWKMKNVPVEMTKTA